MGVISFMFKEKWLLQKHFRKIISGIFPSPPSRLLLLWENEVADIHSLLLVGREMPGRKPHQHGGILSTESIAPLLSKVWVNCPNATSSTMAAISLLVEVGILQNCGMKTIFKTFSVTESNLPGSLFHWWQNTWLCQRKMNSVPFFFKLDNI